MDDIRGIKPIFDISDYYHILFTILGVLVASFALWFLYKKFFKKERTREIWLKELKSVDLNCPKEAAYTITKYARLLAKDEKNQEILNTLVLRLEQYKYKKEIPEKLDEESIAYYKTFVESVDA